MKYCNLLFILFIVAIVCQIFFENQIWVDMNFLKCTNFIRFCVSSWKMITISNYTKTCWNVQVLFCVINYNFSLNNIYIASHSHVVKDSWTF